MAFRSMTNSFYKLMSKSELYQKSVYRNLILRGLEEVSPTHPDLERELIGFTHYENIDLANLTQTQLNNDYQNEQVLSPEIIRSNGYFVYELGFTNSTTQIPRAIFVVVPNPIDHVNQYTINSPKSAFILYPNFELDKYMYFQIPQISCGTFMKLGDLSTFSLELEVTSINTPSGNKMVAYFNLDKANTSWESLVSMEYVDKHTVNGKDYWELTRFSIHRALLKKRTVSRIDPPLDIISNIYTDLSRQNSRTRWLIIGENLDQFVSTLMASLSPDKRYWSITEPRRSRCSASKNKADRTYLAIPKVTDNTINFAGAHEIIIDRVTLDEYSSKYPGQIIDLIEDRIDPDQFGLEDTIYKTPVDVVSVVALVIPIDKLTDPKISTMLSGIYSPTSPFMSDKIKRVYPIIINCESVDTKLYSHPEYLSTSEFITSKLESLKQLYSITDGSEPSPFICWGKHGDVDYTIPDSIRDHSLKLIKMFIDA